MKRFLIAGLLVPVLVLVIVGGCGPISLERGNPQGNQLVRLDPNETAIPLATALCYFLSNHAADPRRTEVFYINTLDVDIGKVLSEVTCNPMAEIKSIKEFKGTQDLYINTETLQRCEFIHLAVVKMGENQITVRLIWHAGLNVNGAVLYRLVRRDREWVLVEKLSESIG